MIESRIELTERLRHEGRWNEAAKFKDVAMKDFRSKGMKRGEASEAAWAAMAEAYPPLSAADGSADPVTSEFEPRGTAAATGGRRGQSGPGGQDEDLLDVDAILGNRAPLDVSRDAAWVYEHLANRNARPEDAPTVGAWSLLTWARRYKSRFFEFVVPKLLVGRPSEDEKVVKHEKKKVEEIRAILKRMQEGLDQELAADVPGTVRKRVQGVLAEWMRRFGLSLPDDASANLETHVAHMVHDCTQSLGRTSGGIQ